MEQNPLLPVRNRIDAIDKQLSELFSQRMQCSEEVARIKQAAGIPIFNPEREAAILQSLRESGGEYAQELCALYAKILALSRERQHTMLDTPNALTQQLAEAPDALPTAGLRIACQGVEGAYAHQASLAMFPGMPVSFHAAWEDVFDAVQRAQADFGVLPIENSSAGSVSHVYDLLIEHKFAIARAATVRVSHCLAAACPAADVREVVSHPQALAQCGHYIAGHGFAQREFSNTAAAAKWVGETKAPHTAAICSETAAEKYGLTVLERDIQDAKSNFTRFVAISRTCYATRDANKISLCFGLPHVVGSLQNVLERFALHRLNMTKIESRPVPDEPFKYHFYLDFTGNVHDKGIQRLIASLSDELPDFTFFGNYAELDA